MSKLRHRAVRPNCSRSCRQWQNLGSTFRALALNHKALCGFQWPQGGGEGGIPNHFPLFPLIDHSMSVSRICTQFCQFCIRENLGELRCSPKLMLPAGGESEPKCAEPQLVEHHFLREHDVHPDLQTAPRAAASPLALTRPLRQSQRRGALPGNSHRVTANFPGKLLGFLLAPVTGAAAKSAAGVLAAAVGPPGREPPLVRSGSSRKGPGLKFKIHFPPRPGSRPRPGLSGSPHALALPNPR